MADFWMTMAALLTRMSSLPYLLMGGCDGAFPFGFIGNIEVDVEGVAAEFVDFGFDLLSLLVEDVAEHDFCAFLRE